MPFVSVITPCFNEEENIDLVYQQIKTVFAGMPGYTYEHIYIDNASMDCTVEHLRAIAEQDKNVKIIVNQRNFGQVRSPYHAFFQARGEAVIALASDLQDPPSLIPEFIKKWESGYKVVLGVKSQSQESPVLYSLRTLYYKTLRTLADVPIVEHSTGFGLYDREVVEKIRGINDPYPYFRGLIAELGYCPALIEYTQPNRIHGITKNNFFSLYDLAMLGIVNHSKVPLRLATMLGFLSALVSILVALFYFVYKLLFWNSFSVGVAPLLVGIFFFASVQLFFLGIVGEYVGAIYTQVRHLPPVVEKERINFDND
jgi:glycosyltransferase involved in cell wall biosynthesis